MSVVSTERLSASERAYASLLDEIQSGALPSGSVLGEVEQAVRLGVSRTPLREALRRLTADGLVVQQSPRVTVVADLDASDILALFEIRRALEETSARIAAQRGDAELFAALAQEFAQVELDAPAGRDDYYALIARFDAALDAAVANDYIASALRTVRTHLVRVRRMAKDKPARLAASAAEHRTIAEALAARDGDLAAHATHVHLHNALAGILDSLQAADAAGERVSSRSASSTTRADAARSTTRADAARSTTRADAARSTTRADAARSTTRADAARSTTSAER